MSYHNCNQYPIKITNILSKDILSFDDAIFIVKNQYRSNKNYYDICILCNKDYKFYINGLFDRKWKNNICGKCYVPKFVTKQLDWIESQKAIQSIVQNKSEVRKKNSDSVKKFWKRNPEKKKMMAEKIRLLHCNKEYRDKVSGNKYRGDITINNEKIKFDSLLELYYLLQNINNKVKRWETPISYVDHLGIKRNYFPDFLINDNTIIEIKGSWFLDIDKDNIMHKANYTKKQYPKYRYSIITEKNIKCYKKGIKQIVKNFSKFNINFYNKETNNSYLSACNENKI